MPKEIKVKFVNGNFVPLEKVNLREGIIVEIEIYPAKDKKKKSIPREAILSEKSFAETWLTEEEDEAWKHL